MLQWVAMDIEHFLQGKRFLTLGEWGVSDFGVSPASTLSAAGYSFICPLLLLVYQTHLEVTDQRSLAWTRVWLPALHILCVCVLLSVLSQVEVWGLGHKDRALLLSCMDPLMLTWKEGSTCFLTLPDHFCLFSSFLPVCLVNVIKLDSFIWVFVLCSPCSDSVYLMEKGGNGLMENGIQSCHIISIPGVGEIKGTH